MLLQNVNWTFSKVDEHRIGLLTAEMGWLRRLAGISRRQRKKNDDTRLELNQNRCTSTKDTETQLYWFGHVKRMNNSTLPAKALETGYKKSKAQRKRWIDNVKEEAVTVSSNRRYSSIIPCSPIVGSLHLLLTVECIYTI